MFQFHSGSIKSATALLSITRTNSFQFHSGSIKSPKNQREILYITRIISSSRRLLLGSKIVNVRLCKIGGRLTRSLGYSLIEVIVGK